MNSANIFQSKRKLLAIIIFFLLLLALPLAVYISQQKQEIRQRAASGDTINLFFSNGNDCSHPATSASYTVGETKTLSLCSDTGNYYINSFNVALGVATGLNYVTLNRTIEGTDAKKLTDELFKRIISGTIRFAKATTDTTQANLIHGSSVNFGSVEFTVNSAGGGSIGVSGASFTTNSVSTVTLSSNLPMFNFSIAAPTPTNTPAPSSTSTPVPTNTPVPTSSPAPTATPTNTPVPTSTPAPTATLIPTRTPSPTPTNTPVPTATLTPVPTSSPAPTATPGQFVASADVNQDGCISLLDFNEWLYAFQHNGTPRDPRFKPDMNGRNGVDLEDYNVWYSMMRARQNLCQ